MCKNFITSPSSCVPARCTGRSCGPHVSVTDDRAAVVKHRPIAIDVVTCVGDDALTRAVQFRRDSASGRRPEDVGASAGRKLLSLVFHRGRCRAQRAINASSVLIARDKKKVLFGI